MRGKRVLLAMAVMLAGLGATMAGQAQSGGDVVLNATEAGKMLPEKVYFKGQSATTQLRNSGGVKFADGQFLLAMMVDTSGYSSDVAQRYQAYLIAERPIQIEGHALAAGIYGVGFVGSQFVVMDVGAHDLFTVPAHHDEAMKRPTPLKVLAEGAGFRLYEGRNYVGFTK
ncbi:MAG TPA: hypothetical protein VL346_01280 [Acidobacteriaceae bacterium]|jgi:hypothetical protein|nr:hypothetical protein [Acidobacteriaceae bacterium]